MATQGCFLATVTNFKGAHTHAHAQPPGFGGNSCHLTRPPFRKARRLTGFTTQSLWLFDSPSKIIRRLGPHSVRRPCRTSKTRPLDTRCYLNKTRRCSDCRFRVVVVATPQRGRSDSGRNGPFRTERRPNHKEPFIRPRRPQLVLIEIQGGDWWGDVV